MRVRAVGRLSTSPNTPYVPGRALPRLVGMPKTTWTASSTRPCGSPPRRLGDGHHARLADEVGVSRRPLDEVGQARAGRDDDRRGAARFLQVVDQAFDPEPAELTRVMECRSSTSSPMPAPTSSCTRSSSPRTEPTPSCCRSDHQHQLAARRGQGRRSRASRRTPRASTRPTSTRRRHGRPGRRSPRRCSRPRRRSRPGGHRLVRRPRPAGLTP